MIIFHTTTNEKIYKDSVWKVFTCVSQIFAETAGNTSNTRRLMNSD